MEELLCRIVQISLTCLNTNDSIFTFRTTYWLSLILIFQVAISQMNPSTSSIRFTDVLCIVLSSIYIIGGFIFSFAISYFYLYHFFFFLCFSLTVLRYSPPFILEKSGSGGILRIFLEGAFWVILHSLALSDTPRFAVIERLPVFLVYESLYLIKELEGSTEDTKKKFITTGILIGRNGCFKTSILLHSFSCFFLVLDMQMALINGLPLILFPWVIYQLTALKQMELRKARIHSLLYYLSFSILTGVSLTHS